MVNKRKRCAKAAPYGHGNGAMVWFATLTATLEMIDAQVALNASPSALARTAPAPLSQADLAAACPGRVGSC
jgi:hypothetical protein